MRKTTLIVAAIAALASASIAQVATKMPATTQAASTQPFAGEIAAFEAKDAAQMPAANGVLFYGSSTIRYWDTKAAFPDLPTINRGFGGSQMSQALGYADRLVTKYQPRLIVLYEGDNDLNAGKKPAEIAADFKEFATIVHRDLPVAKLLVISVKPSPSRDRLKPQMDELNTMLKSLVDQNGTWMTYFDAVPLLLGPDGKPRPELYREDKLHMNPAGYALWNDALRPVLTKLMRD